MVLNRSVFVGMGLAAGAVAAVALYATAAASPAPGPARQVTSQLTSEVQPTTPEPTVSYSPCTPPAELEDGVCVTHRVVTKVVPATSDTHADSRGVVGESRSPSTRHTTSTPTSTREDDAVETEDGDHEDADHEDADHEDGVHSDDQSVNHEDD